MDGFKDEKKRSVCLWGVWASLIIGVFYLGIGVLMIFDPAERYRGYEYFIQLVHYPVIPLIWRSMFVVVAFMTIFWITALDKLLREKSHEVEGLYKWVLFLGYAATVVNAIQWYKEIFLFRTLEGYEDTSVLYKQIFQATSYGMDPDFIWMFGALGAWYLVSSILAQKNKLFNKAGNVLGMLCGFSLVLTMIFAITDTIINFGNGHQMAVMQFTSMLGGVSGALYHINMFFVVGKGIKATKSKNARKINQKEPITG
ncbi:hypothetical protein [Paenibacillus polymyxa]|uniref:hypothetical protein n=1 Tax=Paenibacillus polymyxa TaxID=1406 RepID=UPI0032175EF1